MMWQDVKDIKSINHFIEQVCPKAIKIDGFDDCIIGVELNKMNETHIIYSAYSIVRKVMKEYNVDYFNALSVCDEMAKQEYLSAGMEKRKFAPLVKNDLPNPQLN